MSKHGKYFPDKDAGKEWGNFGVACLLCGLHFYGGIDKAAKECVNHTAGEHPGEVPRYAAFASPRSYEAEKKAKFLTSMREAVGLERIWRDHGSGWYFFALHYGVAEALARISDLEKMEGEKIQGLREKVVEQIKERKANDLPQ